MEAEPAVEPTNRWSVPWNPLLALLFVVFVFFASQFAAAELASVYGALQHWTRSRTEDWLTNNVLGQFVFIVIAEALVIGAVVAFLRLRRASLQVIGLVRPRLRDPLIAAAGYGVYFVAFAIMVTIAQRYVPGLKLDQKQQIGFNSVHGSGQLTLTFISLVVLPPLAEEILLRGFLYTSLRKWLPWVFATIGTSLLFAIAHLPEGGAAGPLYIAALDTFILSLVLCFVREKTGSLWPGIFVHAIKNGIAYLSLFILASR